MSSIAGSGDDRRALRDDAQRRLRDVHRVVADALQVARDLDGADDEAEVARHRLLQREQRDGEVLDLDLEAIDLVVAAMTASAFSLSRVSSASTARSTSASARVGHVEQALLERRQLVVKMAKSDDVDAGSSEPPGDVSLGALLARAGEDASRSRRPR